MQVRLAQSKAQLLEVLEQIEGKPDDMDCATNAKRVLAHFGLGDPENPEQEINDVEAHGKARHN